MRQILPDKYSEIVEIIRAKLESCSSNHGLQDIMSDRVILLLDSSLYHRQLEIGKLCFSLLETFNFNSTHTAENIEELKGVVETT